MEETGAAVAALSYWWPDQRVRDTCQRGAAYLAGRVADLSWRRAEPIGLYFARLWYSERLYPLIWSVAGLGSALSRIAGRQGRSRTGCAES